MDTQDAFNKYCQLSEKQYRSAGQGGAEAEELQGKDHEWYQENRYRFVSKGPGSIDQHAFMERRGYKVLPKHDKFTVLRNLITKIKLDEGTDERFVAIHHKYIEQRSKPVKSPDVPPIPVKSPRFPDVIAALKYHQAAAEEDESDLLEIVKRHGTPSEVSETAVEIEINEYLDTFHFKLLNASPQEKLEKYLDSKQLVK